MDLLAGNVAGQSSNRIQIPDAKHPVANDSDGEQLRQTAQTVGPGKTPPLAGKRWKALATVTETVTVDDDAGDTMSIEISYRLEQRPAEIGEIPDVWIHTERRALLTLGTGEHAGATIIGQARVRLGPDEVLDPRAAIARTSIGPSHSAHVYLEASEQFVNVFGPGDRRSLRDDAASNDVLAYDNPLRMMMGLKRVLKKQHIAGRGDAVAHQHARVPKLLEAAEAAKAILDAHIKAVTTHHDGSSGRFFQIRLVLAQIADWLAANARQGRDDTEEATQLHAAHLRLVTLLERAQAARPPERSVAADLLGIPERLVERTGAGLKELGAMALDLFMLGVVRPVDPTGDSDFDYEPRSKYGQWVKATGAGPAAGLVAMVNGVADQWSDAIERARNGDYSAIMDVGLDTALLLEGVRSTAAATVGKVPQVIAKGAELVAKVRDVAARARALVGRVPAEVGDIAAAMADAGGAFLEKQLAAGMQTNAGPRVPGGVHVTPESLAEGVKAAGKAFGPSRTARIKNRSVETLKLRLGKGTGLDPAEWVTRIEAAVGGNDRAFRRFLDGISVRVTDPAPLMRAVDTLLGSTKLGPEDLALVLDNVLHTRNADPVGLLGEIEWVTTRSLSGRARSMLIRKAVDGPLDLDWLKRTQLTDPELEILAQDAYTDWSGLAKLSDIPGRKTPGRLVDRLPSGGQAAGVNGKVRGVAAELAAAEADLPDGLKIQRRVASDGQISTTDYDLVTRDGGIAELEVKGHTPGSWKTMLDEYERALHAPDAPVSEPAKQILRLLKQVEAGRGRGHRVYVAISDGTPVAQRSRLANLLVRNGGRAGDLVVLPEESIKRIGKQLREHMGIPQPGGKPTAAAETP